MTEQTNPRTIYLSQMTFERFRQSFEMPSEELLELGHQAGCHLHITCERPASVRDGFEPRFNIRLTINGGEELGGATYRQENIPNPGYALASVFAAFWQDVQHKAGVWQEESEALHD